MGLKQIVASGIMMACALGASAGHGESPSAAMTPEQALAAITAGNARYVAGTPQGPHRDQERRCDTFANGQHPIAAVLSCADSRAPVELIFDQGIGDLFVIRVAGNVADTDEIGSIEYSVGHLATPLVVVLGHSKCGAVTAVAEKAEVHGCIGQLVDNIVPALEKAAKQNPNATGPALIAAATRQNVWQSIEDMYGHSDFLREAAKAGKVKVVGAIYDLHSGTVEWMGAHPDEQKLLKEGKASGQTPKSAEHEATPKPAKSGGEKEPAAHSEANAATQPAMAGVRKKENYLALGGLLAGGMLVSTIVIRMMHKQE
ncbi:MAG: carbonic anhydrase [Bacillota bacterium]